MAKEARYAEFLFQLADLGSELEIPKLRECARQILKIMPTGIVITVHFTDNTECYISGGHL